MVSCSNFTKNRALVAFQSRYTITVAALDGAIKVGRVAFGSRHGCICPSRMDFITWPMARARRPSSPELHEQLRRRSQRHGRRRGVARRQVGGGVGRGLDADARLGVAARERERAADVDEARGVDGDDDDRRVVAALAGLDGEGVGEGRAVGRRDRGASGTPRRDEAASGSCGASVAFVKPRSGAQIAQW